MFFYHAQSPYIDLQRVHFDRSAFIFGSVVIFSQAPLGAPLSPRADSLTLGASCSLIGRYSRRRERSYAHDWLAVSSLTRVGVASRLPYKDAGWSKSTGTRNQQLTANS